MVLPVVGDVCIIGRGNGGYLFIYFVSFVSTSVLDHFAFARPCCLFLAVYSILTHYYDDDDNRTVAQWSHESVTEGLPLPMLVIYEGSSYKGFCCVSDVLILWVVDFTNSTSIYMSSS